MQYSWNIMHMDKKESNIICLSFVYILLVTCLGSNVGTGEYVSINFPLTFNLHKYVYDYLFKVKITETTQQFWLLNGKN